MSARDWSTAQWLHTWHLCWWCPVPCLKPFFHEKTSVVDPPHGWESSEVNEAVPRMQPSGLGKRVHHWQVEPCDSHFGICGDRGISATHFAFSFSYEISERIYVLWHWEVSNIWKVRQVRSISWPLRSQLSPQALVDHGRRRYHPTLSLLNGHLSTPQRKAWLVAVWHPCQWWYSSLRLPNWGFPKEAWVENLGSFFEP